MLQYVILGIDMKYHDDAILILLFGVYTCQGLKY